MGAVLTSTAGDALPYFTSALREHEFAYQGILLSRELASPAPSTAA
jgi:hypothetical protein